MKTIRDEKCRKQLLDRLDKLTPASKAAWGRMSVEQMLSHLVQAGELPFKTDIPDRSTFVSRTFIKPLVLYILPMPKEIKTSADMDQQQDGRKPLGFEADKATVIESVNRLGTLAADHQCFYHPFFGKMSAKEWGLIAHKHMDHHLRQFGV
jgi:hypothetical protein